MMEATDAAAAELETEEDGEDKPPVVAGAGDIQLEQAERITELLKQNEALVLADDDKSKLIVKMKNIAAEKDHGSELDSEPDLTICWLCFFWPKPMNMSTVK